MSPAFPELVLEALGVSARYKSLAVLQDVSVKVFEGELVSVVGANGAGKSSLLRAIMGALPPFEGHIFFKGRDITGQATEDIVQAGVVYVPEEKMLFKPLTVHENLMLGAFTRTDENEIRHTLEFVYELFPRLAQRARQPAGTLSGGEQQMVAIGRGLMSQPRILLLDEPSLGLAPLLVDEVLATVKKLKDSGMTILLVEQNVHDALEMADRGYVVQAGRIVLSGSGRELLDNDLVREAYLGM